jgi:multidrug efflux system outer membrane protein
MVIRRRNRFPSLIGIVWIAVIVFGSGGCQIPGLRPSVSGAVFPERFPTGESTAPATAKLSVEEYYIDPVLTQLVQEGLQGNLELKMLDEEIQVAGSELVSRRGAYLPFVGIRGGAGLDKPSRFTREGAVEESLEAAPDRDFPNPNPDYFGSLNLLWRIDIWREFRNARDAAQQRYYAAVERRCNAVTRLTAEIAETYFELMALDRRMEYLTVIIDLQEKSLESAKAKKEAGRGTELPVQRFLAEIRKNQSEKNIVTQNTVEAQNRLNQTLGRYPQPVTRSAAKFFEIDVTAINVGLPSELLQNRPDVRQAERELAAAGLDVLVAKARFYPSLDISASVGYRAFNPRYLVKPEALMYGVAGDLVAPLINRSAIRADYLGANARQLQAVYNYQQVVLKGYFEVVNQLSKVEQYRQSLGLKKLQLEALESSVNVATQLFQNARAEYVEVLLAQRDLLDARMELIETKQQQLSGLVRVYQALGGGACVTKALETVTSQNSP